MKEEALAKLTTREREIRNRMEEMLDPHGVNDMKKNKNNGPNVPLKSSTAKLVNGHHAKSKTSVVGEKKGKKRKVPSAWLWFFFPLFMLWKLMTMLIDMHFYMYYMYMFPDHSTA